MFQIVYTAYGKDYILDNMTEASASKALRNIVSNFYNREFGCTNGCVRHYGEIYITRNGKTVMQYSGGEFFAVKKGEYNLLTDWENIFTSYITRVA